MLVCSLSCFLVDRTTSLYCGFFTVALLTLTINIVCSVMDTNLMLFIVKLHDSDFNSDWHFRAFGEIKGCSTVGFEEAMSFLSEPAKIPDVSLVMQAFVITGWVTVLFTILYIIILAKEAIITSCGLDDQEKLNERQHDERARNRDLESQQRR